MNDEYWRNLLRFVAERCPGNKLPDDYTVLAVDTDGLDIGRHRVVACAVLDVRQRSAAVRRRIVTKRGEENRPQGMRLLAWADGEMDHEASAYNGITAERLAKEGERPDIVLLETLTALLDAKVVVGHAVADFHLPFLHQAVKLCGLDQELTEFFDDLTVLDTMQLAKAAAGKVELDPTANFQEFYEAVLRAPVPRGVGYSLNRLHADYLGRTGKMPSPRSSAQTALIVHHLFEAMRTRYVR